MCLSCFLSLFYCAVACSSIWWFHITRLCWHLPVASCMQPWFYSVRHNVCLPHCRERGQRALEQRLAEKLAAVRSSEGTSLDAADKVWVFYAMNNELCSLWIPGDSFLCDFLKDWSNANVSCMFSSPSPTAECFIFWWFFVVISSGTNKWSVALHFSHGFSVIN